VRFCNGLALNLSLLHKSLKILVATLFVLDLVLQKLLVSSHRLAVLLLSQDDRLVLKVQLFNCLLLLAQLLDLELLTDLQALLLI
jgi:hypothetical protein